MQPIPQGRAKLMEIRLESKKGAVVKSIDPVLADIHKRLQSHPQEWLRSLQKDPAGFSDLEKKVHHAFQQMADQLVAGLLAQATQGDDFANNSKKSS
jgi:hypothetical protein